TWQAGDRVPKTEIRRDVNGWILRSPPSESRELEPQVLWLLDRLPRTLNGISQATTQYFAEFSCAAFTREEMPVLALGTETIRRIAELGAGIDIDINLIA